MRMIRPLTVLLAIGLILQLADMVPRKVGDYFQYALPVAGLGCAFASGQVVSYLGRYVVMQAVLTGSKDGLGNASLNMRPDGRPRGFPSGHTAAAAFGATALVRTCLAASPVASVMVVSAAGFTGYSRVLANRHSILQVVAGALLGCLAQSLSLVGLRLFVSRFSLRAKHRSKMGFFIVFKIGPRPALQQQDPEDGKQAPAKA